MNKEEAGGVVRAIIPAAAAYAIAKGVDSAAVELAGTIAGVAFSAIWSIKAKRKAKRAAAGLR